MPIRSELRDLYPKSWDAISRHIRHERAGNRCEQCWDQETLQSNKEHSCRM